MERDVARHGIGKEERLARGRVEWIGKVFRWGVRKTVKVAGDLHKLRTL